MRYCRISGLLLFSAAALYLKFKYIFRHKDIAEYLAYSYFQQCHLLRTFIKNILFLIMRYCRIPGLLLFSAALQSTFLPAALHHPIPLTTDNPAEKRRGVHQWKYYFISPMSFCAFHFMSICVAEAICLQNVNICVFNVSIPSQNVSTSQIYPTVPFLSSRYLWIKQLVHTVPVCNEILPLKSWFVECFHSWQPNHLSQCFDCWWNFQMFQIFLVCSNC